MITGHLDNWYFLLLARERVGGRTWTVQNPNVGWVDLGEFSLFIQLLKVYWVFGVLPVSFW